MRKITLGIVGVVALIFSYFGVVPTSMAPAFGVNVAEACGSSARVACGNTAVDQNVTGDRKIKKPIEVTICHGYWSMLDIGRLSDGTKSKWWGPTIRFGNWSMNLDAVAKPCKIWWVVPGTTIDTFASCVNRIVSTGRMWKSGTYTLS